MIRKFALALLSASAVTIAVAAGVHAAEARGAVPPLAAVTTDLGHNTSALTYWVEEIDGVHAVTTIDTVAADDGRHAIVRFSALIPSGQSQIISVPGPLGSRPQVLRIRNLGRRSNRADIEIDRVEAPMIAAGMARAIN